MAAAKDPVNDKAGAAENPLNDKAVGAENPVNDKAGRAENPVNDKAVGEGNPVNDQTGASENPVNNKAGVAENPANHQAGAAKNPLNKKASDAENPVINKAVEGEISVINKAVGPENSVNDKVGVAENPVNDMAGVAENPVSDKAGGAENPVNDQAGAAETHADDQAGAAENHADDQAGGSEIPVNDQTGSSEVPVNDQAGSAEYPVNHQAGGSENPVNEQVGGSEIPVNNQAGGSEILVNDQAGVSEILVNDQAGGSANPLNDQASGAENPVNNKAGAAENPIHDRADSIENPLNKHADAAENPVNDREAAAENFVENKEGVAEHPAEVKDNAVENPVNSKADRLPGEAKELLKSLASNWEDVLNPNALQVIPLKGAMTNKVFQIKWPTRTGETSRKVLVRIYGEGVDIFFDRDNEIRTFESMSKNGQGPRLLGRFANGRIEEFIHARTLSASDLRDPSISALIVAKLKEFHDLDMPGAKKVYLWDRLRNWLNEAKSLSSPQEVEAFYLDTIDKEISLLEKELSGAHQRIGFCHNDLQYGNIMLDEETNSVTIIDYEYASYNPVSYDIANHFCEMAADYHTETPHILDFNKYPGLEERERFVQAYLSSSGEQPTDSEVEQLLQEVEKYTLANHLFWGVWGIISGQVNKIDFDYKEYARQRFQEYWSRKPYLLISDGRSPYNVIEGNGELASTSTIRGTSTKNPSSIFRKLKKVMGLSLFRSKS